MSLIIRASIILYFFVYLNLARIGLVGFGWLCVHRFVRVLGWVGLVCVHDLWLFWVGLDLGELAGFVNKARDYNLPVRKS